MQFRKISSAGLALVLAFTVTGAAAAGPEGQRITRVVLKDDRGSPWPEPEGLVPLVQVKAGDPFSSDAVRKGISFLYLKRLFRDIRVEAFAEDGGVRLEYTLFPITLVERIVLRGNHALSDRAVLDTLRNVIGRELREENVPDLRAGIQARYQTEGFYNVQVRFRSEPAATPNRAVLYVYITEPKQTIIEEVRFSGATLFTAGELSSVMKNRKGRPLLTDELLEADMEAIQRKYAEAGHPAARPGPVSMSFRDGRALLEVGGSEGPRVTASFSGTDAFCREHYPDLFDRGPDNDRPYTVLWEHCAAHFRDSLLIWSEHDVSDTVIQSSVDKIKDAYREEGYPDVQIAVDRRTAPGTLDLLFTVREGPRVSVDEIRVQGNRAFTGREIRGLLMTRPAGWFQAGRYRADVLEKDVESLTDRYIAAGYLGAEVKSAVTRTGGGDRATVTLTITEGRRTLTGNVTFEGATVLGPADLSAGLQLVTGVPFSERMLEEDRYRILARYADRGYLYARVEADRLPAGGGDAAADVVDIRYRITEDRQVRIGTVILRGNAFTRDAVILRELSPKSGEPYSYEAILKSQQRVHRYGYFSQARFEPVRGLEKEYEKDMLFTVEERPAGAVEVGIGYGDLDRLRGFAEISHRNLWRSANYASLRIEGSDILERAALTYQMPWVFGYRHLESKLVVAWSDAKRINQDTRDVYYQTRKTSVSYGFERVINGFRPSLTYQFENVDNYNVDPAAQLDPEDSGRVLISSLTPAVVWDLRDNIFDPRRGSLHGLTVKEAFRGVGSDAEFTKVTVQSSWFFPVVDVAVLALSGRAGMAWPHRETVEVPIHERFYLGGSTTVRGFTQDSVGPQSHDASGVMIPTGGASMVQLNAEARFGSTGGFGVVLFSDAGNVWVDQEILLNDLRASYGAGIRYHTPVGPLRIDYGQKIHRRSGESPGELHFNIGHAF